MWKSAMGEAKGFCELGVQREGEDAAEGGRTFHESERKTV